MVSPSSSSTNSYSSDLRRRIKEQKALDKFLGGSGCCLICFSSNPLILQEHHFLGRKHSSFTITVCANHHQILSMWQKSWPEEWLQVGIPCKKRSALMLISLADILRLMAREIQAEEEDENDRAEAQE